MKFRYKGGYWFIYQFHGLPNIGFGFHTLNPTLETLTFGKQRGPNFDDTTNEAWKQMIIDMLEPDHLTP